MKYYDPSGHMQLGYDDDYNVAGKIKVAGINDINVNYRGQGVEGSLDVWDMPEGGAIINGREYSQHALERMAPDTSSVVEDAIRNTTAEPGHEKGTFVHQTADVKVIVNETGKVITVIPN